MDAVIDTGKFCQATLCYTGNMLAGGANKYDLNYYLQMAGLEKPVPTAWRLGYGRCGPPAAIKQLVTALRQEVGLPIAFHTHDTSGIGAASILAAIEAGVDSVDAAMDAFSGLTSQPNLAPSTRPCAIPTAPPALPWSRCRPSAIIGRACANTTPVMKVKSVHRRCLPPRHARRPIHQSARAGQKPRHRAPLGRSSQAYAQVNQLFGDIVKLPHLQGGGDMALMMVTQGLKPRRCTKPDAGN